MEDKEGVLGVGLLCPLSVYVFRREGLCCLCCGKDVWGEVEDGGEGERGREGLLFDMEVVT